MLVLNSILYSKIYNQWLLNNFDINLHDQDVYKRQGQYQHDIPEKNLEEQLDFVVEKTVNNVGFDINTASKSLLKYVAGLNAGVAQQIVLYRNEHGNCLLYTSRCV